MSDPPKPLPTFSEVVISAWSVLRQNLTTFLVIVVVIYLPIDLWLELASFKEQEGLRAWRSYYKLANALEFWIGTIAKVAMIVMTAAAARGQILSVKELFMGSLERYVSALWINILSRIGLLISLLLLILPGIAFVVYTIFVLQSLVVYSCRGSDAFQLSYSLIKGRWWWFFGKIVLIGLLYTGCLMVMVIISFLMPEKLVLSLLRALILDGAGAFMTICITRLFLMTSRESELENFEEPTRLTAEALDSDQVI